MERNCFGSSRCVLCREVVSSEYLLSKVPQYILFQTFFLFVHYRGSTLMFVVNF